MVKCYLVYTTDSQGVKYGCGYDENDNKEAVADVVGIESSHSSNIVIPRTIKARLPHQNTSVEYTITSITYNTFSGSLIQSIVIPNTIKVIEGDAFDNCSALTSILIPDSVIKLGSEAFSRCKNLRSVVLSDNLIEIEDGTFKHCTNLEYVKMGRHTQHVEKNAFYNCPKLQSVVVPRDISAQSNRELGEAVPVFCIKYENESNAIETPKSGPFHHDATSTNTIRTKTTHLTSVPIKPITKPKSSGCYIATAVYGSYDCPEVWTLRRYRDNVLDKSWYGRLFIKCYYAISPSLVKWFGKSNWFRNLFSKPMSKWVNKLNENGFENTPYNDKN